MSNSLSVPLGEQEHLKAFFELFQEEPQMAGKVEDIELLIGYIEELKDQLRETTEEIQYIKDILTSVKDQTLKAKLEKCVAVAKEQLADAKAAYQHVRSKISQDIGRVVNDAKLYGIKAVDKAVDVVGVKKALTAIRNHLGKAVDSIRSGLQRLEAAQKEMDQIKAHIGGLGAAMTGRSEYVAKTSDRIGIFLSLHKALSFCKRQVEGMDAKTQGAIDTVDHLHRLTMAGTQKQLPVNAQAVSQMPVQKQR